MGNPLMREDSIALRVAAQLQNKLKNIEFEEIASIDSLREFPKELVIMDAVKGVEKVCLVSDLEKLSGSNVFSLHDLDSGFQLKLFKKMGKIKKVKIIAIPQKMELKKAVAEATKLLKTIF